MFKKLLIIILLISPLFFLLQGFPITSNKTVHNTMLATSQRCFTIGNTSQFLSCLRYNPKITIGKFLTQTVYELNDLHPFMGYLFVIFLLGQLILIPFIVKEINHDEAK